MKITPEQGDIIYLDLDPIKGHEQGGPRPVLVISPAKFNERSGLAWIAPITRTNRAHPTSIPIPSGHKTEGTIVVANLRSVSWPERMNMTKGVIEVLDDKTLGEVLGIVLAILSIEPD